MERTVPLTAKVFEDFFGWSAQLRRTQPVVFDEDAGVWHVFSHAEAKQVLLDTTTFSSALPTDGGVQIFVDGNFALMDPPEHRQLRGLVSRAFTPRTVADLAPQIETIAAELLDGIGDGDTVDFVNDVAAAFSMQVIAAMLGVSDADRSNVGRWVDKLLAPGRQSIEVDATVLADLARTGEELAAFVLDQIRYRRTNPGNDLLSKLVTVEVDGERLSESQIAGVTNLLLTGGYVTTASLLTTAVLCFEAMPEAMRELHERRDGIPAAIEELVRYRAPFTRAPRLTTAPVVLGGEEIPAGQVVVVWLTSANHDERVFADPERIDLKRDPNPHLGFGQGVHFCLGAPLARIEAQIMLNLFLDRFEAVEMDRGQPLEGYDPAGGVLFYKQVPVRLKRR